jgi:hypothetical protein
VHSERRCLRGVIDEGAEQPDRAELHRHAQPVVVAAVLSDEGAIGVVEVEVAGELVERGVARKAPVSTGLIVGQEGDGHAGSLR